MSEASNTAKPGSVLDAAVAEYGGPLFALFSGGHDSLCSTAIAAAHPRFTSAVHINTGIGIPQTREFVRTTCRTHGWPLIEMHPDGKTYRDLVIEKGMPAGPKAHNTTYYWLKQRQVRRLVAEHKQGRGGRVLLVTGIRKQESERRMSAAMSVPQHRIGAQVWVNPILNWSKADCNEFMEHEGLKRNPVVDLLHRSGECLCGALARREEFADRSALGVRVASNTPVIRLWTDAGFIGLRLGRRYFKIRDLDRHRLMFSERSGHNYRRLARVGSWEFGVRRDAM